MMMGRNHIIASTRFAPDVGVGNGLEMTTCGPVAFLDVPFRSSVCGEMIIIQNSERSINIFGMGCVLMRLFTSYKELCGSGF